MKIALIKIVAASFVVAMFTLSGCKKTETGPKGDPGPQGSSGSTSSLMSSGGYISGTVSGTRKDGVAFNEQFNYTFYESGVAGSGTLDSTFINQYSFRFTRFDENYYSPNYCDFYVNTTSKTATTGSLSMSFYFNKVLSLSKYFSFSLSTTGVSVTGLSFNSVTGLFSGAFNINTANNSTNNPATFTGSFQVNVLQKVQRINQVGGTRKN